MPKVAGYGGLAKQGTEGSEEVVSGIRSWTLDYTAEALETTDFEDNGKRTYIAGLTGWSGSFEGDFEDTPLSLGPTHLVLQVTSGVVYEGDAIITGQHPSVAVDGKAVISYDFQGTGELSVPSVA